MLLAPAESPANYASAVSARSDILGERYVSERGAPSWGSLPGLCNLACGRRVWMPTSPATFVAQ
jgi:hypothetical protein